MCTQSLWTIVDDRRRLLPWRPLRKSSSSSAFEYVSRKNMWKKKYTERRARDGRKHLKPEQCIYTQPRSLPAGMLARASNITDKNREPASTDASRRTHLRASAHATDYLRAGAFHSTAFQTKLHSHSKTSKEEHVRKESPQLHSEQRSDRSSAVTDVRSTKCDSHRSMTDGQSRCKATSEKYCQGKARRSIVEFTTATRSATVM